MSDLTDEQIAYAENFVGGSHDTTCEFDDVFGAIVAELRRHRAARAASPPSCNVNQVSSSACERGTRGCVTEHDLRSALCALLDSDMPAGDLRKALAELVGRR